MDMLTNIQLNGRNDHLEPSGKNYSKLVTGLVTKVNGDSFLMSYLENSFTAK